MSIHYFVTLFPSPHYLCSFLLPWNLSVGFTDSLFGPEEKNKSGHLRLDTKKTPEEGMNVINVFLFFFELLQELACSLSGPLLIKLIFKISY